MTNAADLINELEKLNLSKYPIDKINSIMNEIGKLALVETTFPKGKAIIRARANKPNETFKTVSELSYTPAELNKTFKRASAPGTTMFYGCVVPEKKIASEVKLCPAITTAALEVSRLYRQEELRKFYRQKVENENEINEEKITCSKWVITKDDIPPLITIVAPEDFANNSLCTNELHIARQLFEKNHPKEAYNSDIITKYIADEFAKIIPDDYDYHYLISALFTEMMLRKGFAGVYYQSVKSPSLGSEKVGFNVAIHSKFVDANMRAVVAGEHFLYEKGDKFCLYNDTTTEIAEGQTEINFPPITAPQIHLGREICHKELNK